MMGTENYATKRSHGGGRPAYPWGRWIARGVITLVRGQDFRCTCQSLAQLANWAVRKYGVSVSYRIAKDKRSITLTFTPVGEE